MFCVCVCACALCRICACLAANSARDGTRRTTFYFQRARQHAAADSTAKRASVEPEARTSYAPNFSVSGFSGFGAHHRKRDRRASKPKTLKLCIFAHSTDLLSMLSPRAAGFRVQRMQLPTVCAVQCNCPYAWQSIHTKNRNQIKRIGETTTPVKLDMLMRACHIRVRFIIAIHECAQHLWPICSCLCVYLCSLCVQQTRPSNGQCVAAEQPRQCQQCRAHRRASHKHLCISTYIQNQSMLFVCPLRCLESCWSLVFASLSLALSLCNILVLYANLPMRPSLPLATTPTNTRAVSIP